MGEAAVLYVDPACLMVCLLVGISVRFRRVGWREGVFQFSFPARRFQGVGGTVDSKSDVSSVGIFLWPESLRSPCCGLAVDKNQTKPLSF
ncbi:hypothetical protein PoB_004723400 [Plakobranchus ocellatus]|uniref:Secreted protein n=1 Tax=Plakobranchus ocellatus TaxID=259542 RepID=A0AAV4BQW0_9GAST|nr:hypothetical protein PoB_004723400 [Plakobranchus ocellatus]